MERPGMTGATDPEVLEKAEAQAERLLEELKKEVKVEAREIGVLRKELRITVPAKVIADHMEHNFNELMHDAFVPGFRKGRAPRQLVEKRFGSEVRDSLTTAIVGQSYFAVTENEKLDVLGEPRFSVTIDEKPKLVEIEEALAHFKLPPAGDFAYTCEVELKPQFELPELKGIPVRAPEVRITDEMVAEQLLQRRKIRGRVEPVTEAAQPNDQVIATVVLTVDGQEVKREDNVAVGVRPTRIDGVPVLNLADVLTGVRPGEARPAEVQIPDDYDRPDLRGKAGRFDFQVHEIKRLVPEELPEFLKSWGFENEDEARAHFRGELESERDELMRRAKKAQVVDYLLQHTQLELPTDFSARQSERAVVRRVVELQQQGVPLTDIETRIDELRTSAKEQVARELKLGFILERVAEKLEVEVADEDVNTEIARIAQHYNRRFDRVRDELQAHGQLPALHEQIRNDRCVARLLEDAQVTTEPPPDAAPGGPAGEAT